MGGARQGRSVSFVSSGYGRDRGRPLAPPSAAWRLSSHFGTSSNIPAGMNIGVPKEIKPDEYRVALTPAGALELTRHGHSVLVEAGAGEGSAFPDSSYTAVGARNGAGGGGWGPPR